MLRAVFIGRTNQTNEIISEILRSAFDASIKFVNPERVFEGKSYKPDKDLDIVFVDLNTIHGFGNAPDNLKQINRNLDGIPILVLDHHVDKKLMQPLIEAGASGIISHTPTELKLTQAVNRLLGGDTFYDYPE